MHVILRGIDRAAIFFEDDDRRFFLEALRLGARDTLVAVHAYVLMTNHLHLLMTSEQSEGIAAVMKRVGQRYVQHINRTYRRTGGLFEGRYRSALIEADGYLLACYRYIELNPVRAGMVETPGEYPWSSYHANALGGSDPLIVLEDADLDAAAGLGCKSRLISNGQCCISAKRFIVVESVREDFEQKLVARMAAARLGDPLDETTTLGPMARPDLRENLDRQVKESVAKGARVLLGGEPGAGAYYPATVLTDVAAGMPAYGEELFGPVAAVIAVKDAAEAVRVANDNVYGLGAAIFSTDAARAERIARDEIEAGACFVNALVK
ncbi:MAG: aldehyde dehydrogenase family protein, partial [Halochromatium sp.]